MSKIISVAGKEIKDSRGKPTVEVTVETTDGLFTAACPSGASTGASEALELRDDDKRGVTKALANVNNIIAPELVGKDPADQQALDQMMIVLDGTPNKAKLGANAILPVSMALCRAGAAAKKMALYDYIAQISGNAINMPHPSFNILNGGAHAKNDLELQEFMVVPQKKTFQENLAVGSRIFNNLTELLRQNFGTVPELGDEGGYAPAIATAEQALIMIKNSIGQEPDVKIALDCAATEFFRDGKYYPDKEPRSREQMVEFYKDLAARYPILSIEDPFSEEDWEGFKQIRQALPNVTIIGDDLTTTNIKRIHDAVTQKACNGIIIKLNQIGTVSETIDAVNMAKHDNWKIMVSHRSGETMDDFIADFAVGVGAHFLKAGAPSKPERKVKYDRLLAIEQELSAK